MAIQGVMLGIQEFRHLRADRELLKSLVTERNGLNISRMVRGKERNLTVHTVLRSTPILPQTTSSPVEL